MDGKELARIRGTIGMDRVEFARLIGYTGTDSNNEFRLRKYEHGKFQIPLYIARLAWMILRHHDAHGEMPQFPDWPGYEFDHSPDPQHPASP